MTTQMTVMQVAKTKERLRQALRASYEAERAELGATILDIALHVREASGPATYTEMRRKQMMEAFTRLQVLDDLLAHPESPAVEVLVETAFDLLGVELVS